MKNLNIYLFEKLKIDKNTTLSDDYLPSVEEFFNALEGSGEIEMSDIFDKKEIPYDEKYRDILSIYVTDDTMYYSYQDPSVSYDCEAELDLDVFSDKEIIKIYKYMLENQLAA